MLMETRRRRSQLDRHIYQIENMNVIAAVGGALVLLKSEFGHATAAPSAAPPTSEAAPSHPPTSVDLSPSQLNAIKIAPVGMHAFPLDKDAVGGDSRRTHSPHQPTKEWIDKFKGKFDMGWNQLREQIFANQKRLGVIPASTQLTPWPDVLPKWDTLRRE